MQKNQYISLNMNGAGTLQQSASIAQRLSPGQNSCKFIKHHDFFPSINKTASESNLPQKTSIDNESNLQLEKQISKRILSHFIYCNQKSEQHILSCFHRVGTVPMRHVCTISPYATTFPTTLCHAMLCTCHAYAMQCKAERTRQMQKNND